MSRVSIVRQSSETARQTAKVALAGAFMIVLAFLGERTLFQAEHMEATGRLVEARQTANAIALADERLTMSANMMAATADKRWTTRYEATIPVIDAAIAHAMRLKEARELAIKALASKDELGKPKPPPAIRHHAASCASNTLRE